MTGGELVSISTVLLRTKMLPLTRSESQVRIPGALWDGMGGTKGRTATGRRGSCGNLLRKTADKWTGVQNTPMTLFTEKETDDKNVCIRAFLLVHKCC